MNDLLRYYQVRHKIKPGDLIEFAGSGPISRAIRAKTKKPVNHTAMCIWMQPVDSLEATHGSAPRLYIIEAINSGFKLTAISEALEKYSGNAYWLPLKPIYDHKRMDLYNAALLYEGRPYDWKSLFYNLWVRVPLDPMELYCSEAINQALIDVKMLRKDYSPDGMKKHSGCGMWPGEFADTGLYLNPVWII